MFFPLRLPAQLVAQLQRLAHDPAMRGQYGWKTPTEVTRNLLLRGIRTLAGEDMIDEMLPSIELGEQLGVVARSRHEAMAALNKALTEIKALEDIDAEDAAAQYYHATMDAAKRMHPTVWTEWLIAELHGAFPKLAKRRAPGVTLTPTGKVNG